MVRRLGCTECRRIHHELPDMLIPYKRHVAENIEAVIIGDSDSVAADESTIKRWRTWFNEMADYFGGCLKSITIRHDAEAVEDKSDLFKSRLQRIFKYTGDAPGWLRRTVQSIVNHNLWVHTRLAFCP